MIYWWIWIVWSWVVRQDSKFFTLCSNMHLQWKHLWSDFKGMIFDFISLFFILHDQILSRQPMYHSISLTMLAMLRTDKAPKSTKKHFEQNAQCCFSQASVLNQHLIASHDVSVQVLEELYAYLTYSHLLNVRLRYILQE